MGRKAKRELSAKELRIRKKKRRRRLLIAEGIILVLLVAVLFVWLKVGMISFEELDTQTNDLDEETQKVMEEYITVAIFGVDNRSNGNYDSGNSDSIMIANIDNNTGEIKIVSVYRDTCMDVDGEETFRKCNYAFNHGGAEQAVNMLNRNLDLDIDGYVAVDFYALAGAIDALGGVEIELTDEEAKVMNEAYIGFLEKELGRKSKRVTAGLHNLDGIQAVAYCRVRYTSGGDFKRAERQREVLSKMAEKLKTASVSQLLDLIDEVFPSISTSFNLADILEMAPQMQNYQLVDTQGYPFDKYTGTYGSKGSLVIPCTVESNVRKLHEFLFESELYTPSAELTDLSEEIEDFSGKDEEDALDYGY